MWKTPCMPPGSAISWHINSIKTKKISISVNLFTSKHNMPNFFYRVFVVNTCNNFEGELPLFVKQSVSWSLVGTHGTFLISPLPIISLSIATSTFNLLSSKAVIEWTALNTYWPSVLHSVLNFSLSVISFNKFCNQKQDSAVSTKDNTSAANLLFTTRFIIFDCQAIGDNC